MVDGKFWWKFLIRSPGCHRIMGESELGHMSDDDEASDVEDVDED